MLYIYKEVESVLEARVHNPNPNKLVDPGQYPSAPSLIQPTAFLSQPRQHFCFTLSFDLTQHTPSQHREEDNATCFLTIHFIHSALFN